jgi:hypothetical protein
MNAMIAAEPCPGLGRAPSYRLPNSVTASSGFMSVSFNESGAAQAIQRPHGEVDRPVAEVAVDAVADPEVRHEQGGLDQKG